MNNILVYAAQTDGKLTRAALEALTTGYKLAEALDEALEAVVIGVDTAEAASQAIAAGAQRVYVVENSAFLEYQPDLYIAAIVAAANQADSRIIVFSLDSNGFDLVPRVAHRLKAAALTEVVGFSFADGKIKWTRPVYGGKAMAVYEGLRERQVVGVRSKTEDPAVLDETRNGEIITVAFTPDGESIVTRIVEKVQETIGAIRMSDADIVVAGGRGIGAPESFKALEDLAAVLGGAVGGSRAACDAGWLHSTQQIGQTGAIIAPNLYFAIGISGASQHLAGITSAKNVIAINKDPEAPIFKRATLGIVADYKTILPTLTEELKKLVGK